MEQSLQVTNQQAQAVQISLQEVERGLRDKSLIVVDVLPKEAYVSGHIPGAISLPLAEVSTRAREVIADRDAAIAVYCASDT